MAKEGLAGSLAGSLGGSLAGSVSGTDGGTTPPSVLLGSLYHSDFDAQLSSRVIATGVSSLGNRGLDGAAAVQATGAKQPTYNATGWDGTLPCITFDGVDDLLISTFAGSIGTTKRPYVWFVARRVAAAAASRYPATLQNATATSGCFLNYNTTYLGSRDAVLIDSAVPIDAAKRLIENGYTVNGVSAFVVDGVLKDGIGDAFPAAILTTACLGDYAVAGVGGVGFYANYDLAQLIIASDLPADSQRTLVRAYLKKRWGTV